MSGLVVVPAPEGSGFEGSMVAVDDSPEIVRSYWMRLLGPGFAMDQRCIRVLEGDALMAVHADEYAQVGRLAEACGRLRR